MLVRNSRPTSWKLFPALAAALLLLAARPLAADVVHLANGGRIEGKVEKEADRIVVVNRFGRRVFAAAEVRSIEKKETVEEACERKRAALDPDDAEGRAALAAWLEENGWSAKAQEEYKAVLEIDPDHRGARKALGYLFFEGKWRTHDEVMELQGYVRHDGKWVTPAERDAAVAAADAEEAQKTRRKAERALLTRVRRDLDRIARGTAAECQAAYDDLVTLARERKDEGLEKFAADAKAYYDEYWKAVRRALVTAEVRTAVSKLKRPIDTITTSLGNGPPVTIQLPELQVWSVNTTVVIPAGR